MKDVEDAAQEDSWGTPHDREFELKTTGQKYDAMVNSGRLRAAVRMVTERNPGGLYRPLNKCTKTGPPVIDILRAEYPDSVIPEVEHFDEYSAIITTKCQQSMPIYCAEDEVVKGAQIMGGCAGPTGVDGLML